MKALYTLYVKGNKAREWRSKSEAQDTPMIVVVAKGIISGSMDLIAIDESMMPDIAGHVFLCRITYGICNT
jgi:hypothetical protein